MSALSSNWDRRSVLRASAGVSVPAALTGLTFSGHSAYAGEAGSGARPTTEKLPKQPSAKGPAERFTGDVWVDNITAGVELSRLRASMVRFSPCARTAWHRHVLGQTLHVTEGIGLVRARGGKLIVMRPGDTIYTPPGEWHWHGATREHFMIHLAMVDTDGEGDGATEWGDLVTDEEYDRR
ncbi:(R)-mandelonitrile lyase [Streptomyces scopuliridis]|uniref:Cupin n=1 Tax=Streptomyces scopuliridis RB72 TaxID=1440053 RepID=A0A2T7T9N6_9ACTN|nr:cupin domain-containing protein [Streptomyces scopuliridis]PVE11801.1 cupin [Streptomyces scopuliridis RB72]